MSSFAHEYLIPLIVAVVAGLVIFAILKRTSKLKWIMTVVVVLSVLVGGILYVSRDSRKPDEKLDLVIAGTVIDRVTAASIPGAVVSIVGRTEKCASESTGKFRIQLDSTASALDFVRLRVEKPGYIPYEESVRPGVHDFEAPLQRLPK